MRRSQFLCWGEKFHSHGRTQLLALAGYTEQKLAISEGRTGNNKGRKNAIRSVLARMKAEGTFIQPIDEVLK